MITKEQLITGIINYIDNELMPLLSTQQKWVMGTFIGLSVPKLSKIIDDSLNNSYAKIIEIVNEGGLIDEDRLAQCVYQSAQKYGKLTVNIPIVGTLTFSEEDVNKIANYMKGARV